MFEPTWKEHERDIQSDDAEISRRATDAFIEARDKEISISKKAADWEKDRKAEFAKNKPEWVKEKRAAERSADPSIKVIEEIKSGGSHNYGLKPSRGYLLIKLDQLKEQTDSGIYLATEEISEPNTATVLEVGNDLILEKHIVPTPVQPGAKVLLKKFAGMEITLKGEKCRIIQFSDVLGELI
jgi:co-chaperonin GroES (HSP10)